MKKENIGEIIDLLVVNGIVCKQLMPVDNKDLKTRKNIACFRGIDTDSNYISVWRRFGKTRFIMKELEEFFELHGRLEKLCAHRIFKNVLIVESAICSKTLHVMNKQGWKVHNVSM